MTTWVTLVMMSCNSFTPFSEITCKLMKKVEESSSLCNFVHCHALICPIIELLGTMGKTAGHLKYYLLHFCTFLNSHHTHTLYLRAEFSPCDTMAGLCSYQGRQP